MRSLRELFETLGLRCEVVLPTGMCASAMDGKTAHHYLHEAPKYDIEGNSKGTKWAVRAEKIKASPTLTASYTRCEVWQHACSSACSLIFGRI